MFRNLQIQLFRAFENLSVDPSGRSNFFVGMNSSAKITLLEAQHLLAIGRNPLGAFNRYAAILIMAIFLSCQRLYRFSRLQLGRCVRTRRDPGRVTVASQMWRRSGKPDPIMSGVSARQHRGRVRVRYPVLAGPLPSVPMRRPCGSAGTISGRSCNGCPGCRRIPFVSAPMTARCHGSAGHCSRLRAGARTGAGDVCAMPFSMGLFPLLIAV